MGLTPHIFLRVKTEIDKTSDYILESDKRTFSVKLPLSDNGRKKSFYFDQTFDCNASFDTIHNDALEPLMIQWLDGYNVSLLTCGLSESGKTYLLNGPKNPKRCSGILDAISSNLFSLIDKKISDNGYTYGGYRVGIQSFEIYAEMGRDLLDPVRDGLEYCDHELYGATLNGVSTFWVNNATDLNQKLVQARSNRAGENSDSGDLSVIFTVLILARQEYSSKRMIKGGEVISKLVIVDQCGAEMYLKDSKKIVLKEGLFVAKTILGFWDAIQSFAVVKNQNKQDPSIVTKLLQEEIGGNSLVAYFFCINPADDLAENFALLNIIEIVLQVVNFPVRNDENFQSFQRKLKQNLRIDYEKNLDMLRDIINSKDQKHGSTKFLKNGEEKSQHDYEKLFCRFEDLNSKFNSILVIKSNLEASLINLEKQNLVIQKSHIDSQMAQSKAVEESEMRSLELSNKIIALESEMIEMEHKVKTFSKENSDSKLKVDLLTKENDTLKGDLSSLKNIFENLRKSYKKLVDSNEEMALELVGLLNAKEKYITEREKILAESQQLSKHNIFLESKLRSYDSILAEKGLQLSKLKQEKTNIENTLVLANSTKRRLDKEEKNTENLFKQKKEELISDAQNTDLKDKISILERSKKELEQQLKTFNSTEDKLRREVQTLESKSRDREVKLLNEISDLQDKIKVINQKYRLNLESCIQKVFVLSEKTQLDQLSLTTLKSHIDQIILHIKNSVKDIKKIDESAVYTRMESQLHDYIKSTQLDFEKERSALLKRCLIAEKRLESMSKT